MIQLRRGIIVGLCGIGGIGLIVLIVQTLAYLDFKAEVRFPPYDEVTVILRDMKTKAEIEVSDDEERRQILNSMRSIKYAGIRSPYVAYSSDDDPYTIFVISKDYFSTLVIAENSFVNHVNGRRFKIRLGNCEDTLMIVRDLFEKYN